MVVTTDEVWPLVGRKITEKQQREGAILVVALTGGDSPPENALKAMAVVTA